MADVLVHPFERAGLGLAPFRCIDAVESNLSGCAYCGTGIKIHCLIRSSDGKTFIVGTDCVAKVELSVDKTLALDVRKAMAKIRRAKADARREREHERMKVRVAGAREILAANPGLLANKPHPYDYFTKQGKTLRDYYVYCLTGGMQGRKLACEAIEKAAAASAGELVNV